MQQFFGNGSPRRPQRPLDFGDLNLPSWMRVIRWTAVGLVLVFLLVLLNWARTLYTDWLWFSDLGYQDVLATMVTTRIWLFLAGMGTFLLLGAINIAVVFQLTRSDELTGGIITPEAYAWLRQLMVWLSGIGLLLISLIFGTTAASQWDMVLQFMNSVPFEESDPIFNNNVGFYVFTLPLLHLIRSWLLGAVVVLLLATGAAYLAIYAVRGQGPHLSTAVKIHLAGLGAVIFVLIAAGHWLGRYDLLYSTMGTVFGVGFTDANATLPARQLLTGIALLSAGLLLAGAFSSGYRLMVGAVGLWIGMSILAGGIYPSAIQRFQVEPSELTRERPYLDNHIQFTRQAYALDRVRTQEHPARGVVDAQTISEHQVTVNNIRLWDEGPLLDSYNQIQFFRLYYDFLHVTTDRYQIGDEVRQVMVSTRELTADKLPQEAQRWVNRHLQFTHGYGVAMSPATEVAPDGRPNFFVKDIPPQSTDPSLQLDRPEIYYGLQSLDFVIPRGEVKEFNYPGPEGPVHTSYTGEGGVDLDSFFRRFLYAWQFGDLNILISGSITDESLIQYRRTVPERFSTIMPLLQRDQNPYAVVADKRLFWVLDAYTTTDRYPYSLPWQRRFNYMRNSVKAVVDAYNGTVDYYVSDPSDPIIQTYQRMFPGLFKPLDEMPDSLKSHIRYPTDYFSVQTQMLLQYHMDEAGVFYNKEDQWSLPIQSSFGRTSPLEPYFIVARLPGGEEEEFLLIQPFTPSERHNMIAWIAARSSPEHYGDLVLFRFPRGTHVDGPNQVEGRIDNDATISEQFTLWGQVGSEVSRGHLFVVPVGDSILYAEPVFLKPEALEFPELRRIIIADSRKVVMHPTLDRSVRALVGELPTVAPVEGEDSGEVSPPEDGQGAVLGRQELQELARGLEEAIGRLQETLDRLKALGEAEEGTAGQESGSGS